MSKPPRRRTNESVRSREHLTEEEVARLIVAAGSVGRNRPRDAAMVLIAYRHGLRAAELVGLRWDQLDPVKKTLYVTRVKRGTPGTHPLRRDELAALGRLGKGRTGPIFQTSSGNPLGENAWHKIVARAGVVAELPFPVHPHMLRHACGYYLANHGHDTRAIQAWLGHRSIAHTVRYTDLAPDRFRDFFAEEDARG